MKRIITVITAAALLCAIFCFGASAETYNLVPDNGAWNPEDNGGCTCSVTFTSSDATFEGSVSGTWPATFNYFSPEESCGVDISEYALHYDFTVENGQTNILFIFSKSLDDMDNGFQYTICNTALGDVNYEGGSGDLQPDTYAGYIPLTELVESKTLLNGSSFDKSFVDADNKIYFTGIKVYSVGGAVVTIYDLEIVPVSEIPDEPSQDPVSEDESSEDASSDVPSEPETPSEDESSEAPSDTPSTPAESSTENNAGADSFPWWIAIVAAVIVIAVVVFIIVKKKK